MKLIPMTHLPHLALRGVTLTAAAATAVLTACTTATAPPLATPTASAQTLAVPAGYRMVWSDEFDRDGLPDATRWAYDTGMNKAGWHNRELQYYAGPRAENAVVRDGRLVITARRETLSNAPDWGGQRYTSTRLITLGRQDCRAAWAPGPPSGCSTAPSNGPPAANWT
jgi:hypothetical protein